MTDSHSILIADDDRAIIASLRLLLKQAGFDVVHANTPQELLYLAKTRAPTLILMDMNYTADTTSGGEGLDLLIALKQKHEHIPIVVMTGWATVDLAVAAMQRGAHDFVQKPWDNNRLLSVIKAQLELAESKTAQLRLSRENQILKESLAAQKMPLIAHSQTMQNLLKMAKQAALSDANIFITGENGTGKSLLAEYLHQHSPRLDKPFVNVNMGAIPESLFESELFGHVKGAFTDAKSNRLGRIELAQGGTLFLDEIGNLPLSQQAKVLHLLESRQYQAVGSDSSRTADIRLITATNADLQAMVEQQSFRMDLFYRINTVTLSLPALRQRREDIIPLAHSFCTHLQQKYAKSAIQLSDNAKAALTHYHWPGNVRELSHVMERATIFCTNSTINADDLMLQDSAAQPDVNATGQLQTLSDMEKQTIVSRLAHFQGNANQAADSLGLSRSAFYRRLDKYKIG